MFKFGKAALYERLLKEKHLQLDMALEQIEYLRAQLAFKGTHVLGPATPPAKTFGGADLPVMEATMHVSDEELDAQAMLENGDITREQVAEVLEALGVAPEFDLDTLTLA